jgi:hypothetical protein
MIQFQSKTALNDELMSPATIHVPRSSCKLSDCNQMWIFSTGFHKSLQYQISRKPVRSVTAAPIHADRRTDMTKLKGSLHDFMKAPKTAILKKRSLTKTRVLRRVSQDRACLSRRKPAPAAPSCNKTCPQAHHVRGRVYLNIKTMSK